MKAIRWIAVGMMCAMATAAWAQEKKMDKNAPSPQKDMKLNRRVVMKIDPLGWVGPTAARRAGAGRYLPFRDPYTT